MSTRLVVFSRYPVPGKTKTRLIPLLGPEGAAALQEQLTRETLALALRWAEEADAEVEVRGTGAVRAVFRRWLGDRARHAAQGGGDLGRRMALATRQAFRDGLNKVLLIGSDCPDLTSAHLHQAVRELDAVDLVVGPACDGGYYLLGLRTECPELFQGIAWGGAEVLRDTLAISGRRGLSHRCLETLADLDEPADYRAWRKRTQAGAPETN